MSFDTRCPDKVLVYDGSDESYEVACAENDKLSFVAQTVLANGGYRFCDIDYEDMKIIIRNNPHFATNSFYAEKGLGQEVYNWYCSLTMKQESSSQTMFFVTTKDPVTVFMELGLVKDDGFDFCCSICVNDYAPEGETIIGIFY